MESTAGVSRMELIRRSRGLSVKQVAAELDYSENWIWFVERRCAEPARISRRLRKALERFYGEGFEKLIERVTI